MKSSNVHILCIVSVLVVNLLQSYATPLVDDEAYYWTWSRKLALGYYDHPPMIAYWIKIGYSILQNTIGLRLISCVANALVFLFWIDIVQPKTKQEVYLFWIISLSFVGFQLFGFVTTPDACLLFMASFYIWILYKFSLKSSFQNILLLALAIALVMYAKYHAALLIACTVLYFFKERKIWISVGIALFLYSPHLYWQYQNDFISIQYHLFHRNDHTTWKPRMIYEFLLGAVSIGSPLLLVYIYRSFRQKLESTFEKSLRFTALFACIFFFLSSFRTQIQPQWMLIVYLCVFPIVYNFVRKLPNPKPVFILSLSTIFLILILRIALCITQLKTPMWNLKNFVYEAKEVTVGIPVFERYQKAAAYSFYTQEKAYCISMYNHRKSQYDLWQKDIEATLQGQEITFFAMENVGENSIPDENNQTLYYNTISSYETFPKITVSRTNSDNKMSLGDDFSDEIRIDTSEIMSLNKESRFELGLVVMNEKNHPNYIISIPLELDLQGKPIEEEISVSIPFEKIGNYSAYYFIKQKGMSGKLISEKMTIHVVE